MDLSIENVEHLTLNFSTTAARPSLASLIDGLAFSVERGDKCRCPACTERRENDKTPVAGAGTPTQSTIPRIGAVWPGQGGVNAGLMRGIDGGPDYYLIGATGTDGGVAGIKWAGTGVDSQSCDATHHSDGLANTSVLVGSALDFPAARWAAALTIEGHSDFYLPARRELEVAEANVPEIFEKGYHWSSTQYSRYGAWCQVFDDGVQYGYDKSAQLRARAFRRFIP